MIPALIVGGLFTLQWVLALLGARLGVLRVTVARPARRPGAKEARPS
jgi:hypothetical protein